MKGFVAEFKAFAMRGNVVDLAVAVVIGAAFGKIVSSLVDDVIMPVVGVLTGGVDFSKLMLVLKEGAEGVEPVTINYGVFINQVVAFTIIAFVIFLVVKAMTRLQKKAEAAPAAPAEPSEEVKLLREIRDSLKK